MSEAWNVRKVGESAGVIVVALLLGIAVDQVFQHHSSARQHPILRIALQFAVIIGVVIAADTVGQRFFAKNLSTNVFFVAVFLGVQQNLLKDISRVRLYPKPKLLGKDELSDSQQYD